MLTPFLFLTAYISSYFLLYLLIRLPPQFPRSNQIRYALLLAMLISTQTDAVLKRWVSEIFILSYPNSSFLPPGPNPERLSLSSPPFVILFYCHHRFWSKYLLVESSLSPSSLILFPEFCCRNFLPSSSLFSPKILRSELRHGSWMDVGDFRECCRMLEVFGC